MSDIALGLLIICALLSINSDKQYSSSTTSQVVENNIVSDIKTDYSYGLCFYSIIPIGYYGTESTIITIDGEEKSSTRTISCNKTEGE